MIGHNMYESFVLAFSNGPPYVELVMSDCVITVNHIVVWLKSHIFSELSGQKLTAECWMSVGVWRELNVYSDFVRN